MELPKFNDFLKEAKTEEAEIIRNALKKELGLTSKDVSVKTKSGGYSTAVDVTIKTLKALYVKTKIEEIGDNLKSVDYDERTGEILAGGNTFIFTKVDYKLDEEISKLIQDEFEKQTKGNWDKNKQVILFKTFAVNNSGDMSYVSLAGKGGSLAEIRDIDYIGDAVKNLIRKVKNDSLYTKIK